VHGRALPQASFANGVAGALPSAPLAAPLLGELVGALPSGRWRLVGEHAVRRHVRFGSGDEAARAQERVARCGAAAPREPECVLADDVLRIDVRAEQDAPLALAQLELAARLEAALAASASPGE